jgi:DNA-binding SARP family transcriptional activator/TolB-like protein
MVTLSQTPPLLITLLGRFGLRVGGQALETIPRKARALLAYLAMQDGKPVSREAMADLLWTDRGAEQARHSLRQMLLVLRRDLNRAGQPVLSSDERTLSFVPGTVESDVGRLRRLAGSAERADLAEAAGYYTGRLLDGFPAVAADFDDWLTQAREQVDEVTLDVLARLAESCTAAGDLHAAVSAAERMVAIDPLREDVHRRVMEAYWRAGRRSDAIKQYNACVEVLKRDLDVAPSSETVALLARIRGEERPGVAATAEPVRGTVFAQPSGGPPWIAVLPFRAIGPDPVPGYFAAGLVEDIVCMLATLREPVVVSSNSTLRYRDQPVDLRRVGRELGVRYVASGSVRKVDSWLRISVELADADTSAVLWAHQYDVQADLLFEAQDRIVAQIVTTWLPRLHEAEMRRIRGKRPEVMTAYDIVLQAREHVFQLDRTTFERVGPLLQRAIALDPHYATAQAMMADWLNLRIGQGWSADASEDAHAIELAAQAAINNDPLNARALAIHGHNRSYLYRDYDTALRLFDQSLDAAPNDATGWMWSASTYAYVGDGPDAVRRAERGLRLSPRDPFLFRFYASLALAHYTNGTYEEAVHWGERTMQEAPNYTSNLRFTAASLVELGRLSEARALVHQLNQIQPDYVASALVRQHPYRDLERRQKIAGALVQAGLPE